MRVSINVMDNNYKWSVKTIDVNNEIDCYKTVAITTKGNKIYVKL